MDFIEDWCEPLRETMHTDCVVSEHGGLAHVVALVISAFLLSQSAHLGFTYEVFKVEDVSMTVCIAAVDLCCRTQSVAKKSDMIRGHLTSTESLVAFA